MLLDELIPARTVTIRRRSSDPWFDSDCRQAKREARRLERLARRCGTLDATAAWTSKRHEYRALRRRNISETVRDRDLGPKDHQ